MTQAVASSTQNEASAWGGLLPVGNLLTTTHMTLAMATRAAGT